MFLIKCSHLPGHSNVVLDDCKFHECVDLAEFEHDKVLHITPPDGEVSLSHDPELRDPYLMLIVCGDDISLVRRFCPQYSLKGVWHSGRSSR